MKLVYKFGLWYLVITLLALAIGGVISYREIKEEVDFEQSLYLRGTIETALRKLRNGAHPDSLKKHQVEVRMLPYDMPEIGYQVSDTLVMHQFLQRIEEQVKVGASYKVDGKHYYIAAYDGMVESDDINDAVLKSIASIFLVILVTTGLLSVLISRQLLSPFHKTLKAIRQFRLNQKEELLLPPTRTQEFRKLNLFLGSMTQKARGDYRTLKEFTENASHELQTPLSIIRGKLELLMDSNIDDQQARLIMSAHNEVQKLSRMGQSLLLLTKLENHEFDPPGRINISPLLSDSLVAFEELLEMKSITLEQDIHPEVLVSIHPVLADILLKNLLSNAIRHNFPEGHMRVQLRPGQLSIANTGPPLQVAPDEIFERFKKGNQQNDSLGLGLAIVKQICEQNHIRIEYGFRDGMHHFELQLPEKEKG